jgi:hypothetical protein
MVAGRGGGGLSFITLADRYSVILPYILTFIYKILFRSLCF